MKYIVDICKTTPYTDLNGIGWWSDIYFKNFNKLDFYKGLVGQNKGCISVVEVLEQDGWIKAIVDSKLELTGFYLNTRLTGTLDDCRCISKVDDASVEVENIPTTEDYAVPLAKPFEILL